VNTTNPYIEVTGMRHGDIQVSGGLGVSGDLDTSGDLDVSGNLYVETGDTIVSNLNVGTVTATDIHASNIYTNGLNLRHLNDVLRTRIETLEVELQNLKEKYEEMENG
ncbi:MAG: hypothetical protein GWO20_12715, partial [Candidatus Korarchaeota archaeon]|nr:hypothetical protein [Candidatus Korarchaeota archaeon]